MVPGGVPRGSMRFAHQALWSLTWSSGVGIGVALGGWLTVAGGSGSPGAASLDVGHDLVVVPLLSALAVFCVLLVGRVLAELLRSRSSPRP